jgi:MFS family permease
MVGLGETYLAAFALALGMGEVTAGLLSTLPLLAGGVLQLLTPTATRRLGSRRTWVVVCATVQASTFVPLIVLSFVGKAPPWLVFIVAAFYWGSGMAAGPAWNTWIGSLVPEPIRARFLTTRTSVTQVGIAAGLVAGGFCLELFRQRGRELWGFAALFLVAALARGASARLLALHSEPETMSGDRIVGVREVLSRLRHGEDGRLLLFLACMTTSVTLASPFFTPYMLRQLELSYAGYMGLVGAAFVAKIVALSFLGRKGPRLRPRRLLRLGAAGIVPVSILWLVSDDYWYLVGVQVLSGAMWSMYELAAFLIIFETIRENERTSLLTTYNLVNTVGTALGSILGGMLLAAFPSDRQGYHAVFAVSTVARLITGILLLRLGSGRAAQVWMTLRTIGVRPSSGGMLRPIVPGIRPPDEDDDAGDGDAK